MGENDLKEVFQRMNAIEKVLAKIETNTSHHITTMVDHEQRLRTLEARQWKVSSSRPPAEPSATTVIWAQPGLTITRQCRSRGNDARRRRNEHHSAAV